MEQDIDIVCGDCKLGFVWTAGEQVFMKGLQADGKIKDITAPKRCPDCRVKRKNRDFSNDTH